LNIFLLKYTFDYKNLKYLTLSKKRPSMSLSKVDGMQIYRPFGSFSLKKTDLLFINAEEAVLGLGKCSRYFRLSSTLIT
jgi:hypothetical protein